MTGRPRRALARTGIVIGSFVLAACWWRGGFEPKNFKSSEELFAASLHEYQAGHVGNASQGFERLTLDLPSRDPLLPRSFWYLAESYDRRGDHLIAAQNFQRIAESFPDDSLADDALLAAGKAYAKMWTKPELDPQYGLLAQGTLRGILSSYPETVLRGQVVKELDRIDEMLATKDYDTALHYMRRKGYDSAIIYFKDVMKSYAATGHARLAGLRLLESYHAIKYAEESHELCASLTKAYPQDPEVRQACALPPPRR